MLWCISINHFPAPTAVRDVSTGTTSQESIYISWNHPQYPNSQLTQFIIYYRANPPIIQMSPNILNDGFIAVPVPVDIISFNLSGLSAFTNYSIHMSVRGGVSDAPIETELIARTNSSGKLCTYGIEEKVNIFIIIYNIYVYRGVLQLHLLQFNTSNSHVFALNNVQLVVLTCSSYVTVES